MKYLFEMHYHTKRISPCAHASPREMLPVYKALGYSGVVVTDHFNDYTLDRIAGGTPAEKAERWLDGYREARETGEKIGLKVLLGMELKVAESWNDTVLFGISEQFVTEHPDLLDYSEADVSALCRANGILYGQVHPYRDGSTPLDPSLIDCVEVYNGNPGHFRYNRNELALDFAEKNGLIAFAGSDCHAMDQIGTAGTWFSTCPESAEELAVLMRDGGIAGLMTGPAQPGSRG